MSPPDPVAAAEDGRALADLNRWLEKQRPEDRIAWALSSGAENHAMSSSFGAQSAVSLHLLSQSPDLQSSLPLRLYCTQICLGQGLL